MTHLKLSLWVALIFSSLIAPGVMWWLHAGDYESTDDAQIESHPHIVSARISGIVSYVNPQLEKNQLVDAGRLLLEIDSRDYQADLQRAIANLQTRIVDTRFAIAELEGARAAREVTDARGRLYSATERMDQARLAVFTAQLNLSHTMIFAPVGGTIGLRIADIGDYVESGQALLVIVPSDDIWITAYFRKKQLRNMRPDQSVTVRLDRVGPDYKGRVESLPGAASPLFSLVDRENVTEKYVKTVQRFPVRIRLDNGQNSQHLLRPGTVVKATVKVR